MLRLTLYLSMQKSTYFRRVVKKQISEGGSPPIRLNSLKFLETEVQNPKSGFEAVTCIPSPGVPPSLLELGN